MNELGIGLLVLIGCLAIESIVRTIKLIKEM